MTAQATERSIRPAPDRTRRATADSLARWRLSGRLRKTVLVAHISAAGAWIGLDVVMGTLVLTMALTDDLATKAVAAQALELFAVVPMFSAGLLTLVTGVVLGIGSKYGLVRYWWVAVKLVLNVALTSLVLISLRSGVHDLAEQGRLVAAGAASALPIGDLGFPPIVSTSALLFAVVLSVFKPWGRVRRNQR
jgi:hypothetical protein